MPRKKQPTEPTDPSALDYRYDAKRTNIPPAGLAAQGQVREVNKVKIDYVYDAHRPPVLRFDPTGAADEFPLPELLKQAQKRPLKEEEVRMIGLRSQCSMPFDLQLL